MNSTIYDQQSIRKLIFTFSLPAILALLVEMMTSVVDTSFAGHLGNQGQNALTAMGLVSPLLAAFVALQSLFAIATAVSISRYMGRQDSKSLKLYFQNGVLMTFFVSMSSSLVVFLFIKAILLAFGAEGDVYKLAYDYLKIILVSNIFSAIGYTLTSAIRAFGHPKVEAFIITLSVVLNIVANSMFTFIFDLGITGIALGTLFSEVSCALLTLLFLRKKQYWFAYTAVSFKDTIHITYSMLKIGIAQSVIQLLAGVTAYIVNHQLISIGGNTHVAVWNVANKNYLMALMPIIGLTQAVQTIVAYFDGKSEKAKKTETVFKTITYCFIYGIAITTIVYLFGRQFLRLFTSDPSLVSSAMDISKVLFVTFPLLGITYTIMMLLQVTERELQAVLLGLVRQVISIVPLVILLPMLVRDTSIFGQDAAFSIFYAMPIADLVALSFAFFLFKKDVETSNLE